MAQDVLPAIVEVVGCVHLTATVLDITVELVLEPHTLEHAAVIVAEVGLFDALNKTTAVNVVQSIAAVVVVVADLVLVEVVKLDIVAVGIVCELVALDRRVYVSDKLNVFPLELVQCEGDAVVVIDVEFSVALVDIVILVVAGLIVSTNTDVVVEFVTVGALDVLVAVDVLDVAAVAAVWLIVGVATQGCSLQMNAVVLVAAEVAH
jgi:hypothetical protein